jgi:hypothetical protein
MRRTTFSILTVAICAIAPSQASTDERAPAKKGVLLLAYVK